ncbi:acyl-CoA-binding protein [Psychroflexus sp. MBR-150]|jgi:acyl-CoA-binding protein
MDLSQLNAKELEQAFQKAYQAVSETDKGFQQDTLLYFYAYYKHATKEFNLNLKHHPHNGEQLVNAFKMNALFQIRHLSVKQSKIKYIELAIKHLGDDFLKK